MTLTADELVILAAVAALAIFGVGLLVLAEIWLPELVRRIFGIRDGKPDGGKPAPKS